MGELRVCIDDDVSIFVRTDGRHRPGAVPVVCLPGLTRNSRDFTVLATRLGSTRFVARLDLRGRGYSSYADPSTYVPEVYATDVVAVLDALGIERAVLVGTSLGGSVASLTAAWHPERVAGVVLNDVGPVLDPAGFARIQSYAGKLAPNATWPEAVAQARSLVGDAAPALDDATWERLAREQYRELAPGEIRPDHDPLIVAGFDQVDPATLEPTWALYDALATVPTLALRGEHSDVLAAATLAEMARRKPDLATVVVAGRGHCPLLDEPEVTTALDGFLAMLDP